MGRLEVACRRFATLSGIRQEPGSYSTCILPDGALGQRKGLLAVVTEPAGNHPALAAKACGIVQEVVTQGYFDGEFFSLTSGLLKSLEAANSALLEYNYRDDADPSDGHLVVRTSGTRARNAQVGLTAVLLRPDGAGIYIAQLAPTQAYLVHNGILTALPEPESWRAKPGKVAVHLRRVPNPSEEEEAAEAASDEDEVWDGEGPRPGSLPARPLGSDHSVDVDLMYRRVEAGDMVVIVSSSLARLIDRPMAEELFTSGDADYIADSLYELASEHGLAQSHACALKIGAEASSGVDPYRGAPAIGHAPEPAAESQSVEQPAVPVPTFANVLRGPRDWLAARRKPESVPEQEETVQPELELFGAERAVPDYLTNETSDAEQEEPVIAAAEEAPEQSETEQDTFADDAHISKQPTEVLLQHALEMPPYKVHQTREIDEQTLQPAASTEEELNFDGWEDQPPVFLGRSGHYAQARERSGWTHGTSALERKQPDEEAQENVDSGFASSRPRLYPVPTLFDEEGEDDSSLLQFPPAGRSSHSQQAQPLGNDQEEYPDSQVVAYTPQRTAPRIADAVAWAQNVGKSLLPDRSAINRPRGLQTGGFVIPSRLLIGVGLGILVLVLGFSLFKGAGNAKQNESARLLQEAKQEETLGSQPDLSGTARLQHLRSAADKAQLALTADPKSADAQLLAGTIQGEIDTLQGISRVDSTLLFDLDQSDSSAAQAAGAAGATGTSGTGSSAQPAAGAASASSPLTATGHLSEIVIQSNYAYVLDKEKGQVYRCKLATHDCAAVLKSGDQAGGQKVGSLLAMTVRVDNLAVLDNNLVAFLFNSDTSGWEAQPLGASNTLEKPKDFTSFEGNLYLLGSKPGQIEKYPSGQYAQPPVDWVQDPAAVELLKNAVSFGIDGVVYVLGADGKIQVMQAGKITRTMTPKVIDGAAAPTGLVTATDLQGIYVLRGTDQTVTHLNKDGAALATLKPDGNAGAISGFAVDEGRGKMYLLQGRKVYEAALTPRKSQSAPTAVVSSGVGQAAAPQSGQPAAIPTAAP